MRLDAALDATEALYARHRSRLAAISLGDQAARRVPNHEVVKRPGGYESTGEDPQLALPRRRWRPGYYLLYTRVVPSHEGAFAKLHIDAGEGFREETAAGLTVH